MGTPKRERRFNFTPKPSRRRERSKSVPPTKERLGGGSCDRESSDDGLSLSWKDTDATIAPSQAGKAAELPKPSTSATSSVQSIDSRSDKAVSGSTWGQQLTLWKTRRRLGTLSVIVPMMVAYGKHEKKKTSMSDQEYSAAAEALDAKYARKALNGVLKYKGVYMKGAQLALSTNQLRGSFQETLEPVLNAVNPRKYDDILKVLGQELGRPEQHFASIDKEPLGAASVGQVHRAVLLDGGRAVAIKVRFPDVVETFATDLRDLVGMTKRFNPAAYDAVKAWAEVCRMEADLAREARLMERIAKSLAAANVEVVVPRPVLPLCTEKVLVMSLIPGQTLLEGLLQYERSAAAAHGLTVDQFRMKQQARAHNPCHALIGLCEAFAAIVCGGTRMLPTLPAPLSALATLPGQLCDALGHLVLVEGLILCDPHPGNLMLLPDGRLGLIDFGQVHVVDDETARLSLCVGILAVAHRDKDWLMRNRIKNSIQRTQFNDADIQLMKTATVFCATWDDNAFRQVEYLEAKDPTESSDPIIGTFSRMLLVLRSMCAMMGQPSIDLAARWAPLAQQSLFAAGRAEVYRKRLPA